MLLHILRYINKFLVPSNFKYEDFFHCFAIFFFSFNFGFSMNNETLGITLLFQFQRVHIHVGITLLISYYCYSHFIQNYEVRNPISNKNKKTIGQIYATHAY